jgi:HSP20 family protein
MEAMDPNVFRGWMWSEACAVLARAERLQREMFRPVPSPSGIPYWEPPIDVLETDEQVLILVALPGVNPNGVDAVIADGYLLLAGARILPEELQTAVIHRLELPQGRFERRIRLPAGRYGAIRRTASDGCLLISLQKTGAFGG